MKLFAILAALALMISTSSSVTLAETVVQTYDQPSDKANEAGQIRAPGSPPVFPGLGLDSQSSKACWRLTYTDPQGTHKYINLIAAGQSINLALQAMNTLTVGQGLQLGEVTVEAEEIAPSECGF